MSTIPFRCAYEPMLDPFLNSGIRNRHNLMQILNPSTDFIRRESIPDTHWLIDWNTAYRRAFN